MTQAASRGVRLLARGSAASPAVRVYLLCALGVAALWPSFSGLARLWHDTTDYGHGYAVAAVSIVWLLVLRRRIDATLPMHSEPRALPVLFLATVTWLIAYRANSEIVQQLIAPATILLAVLAATGWRVTRRVFGPVAYLYFAVPIWDQLLPLLQSLTIRVSESTLRLLQVPAVVESYMVTIPEGRFAIIEGCSGKRYLLVALAFSTLVGVTYGLRARRIALLVAAAAGLALIANWVRVVVIIYAGHVSNMEHYLVAKEHGTFGWLLYVPLLVGVVLIARRLTSSAPADQAAQDQVAHLQTSSARSVRAAVWLAPTACLCLPMLAVAIGPVGARAPQVGQLPVMVSEWQGPLPADGSWQPQFASPADERRAAYASSAGDVQVYVNVYGVQSQGQELIYFSNTVLPRERWTILERLPERDGMSMVLAKDSADTHWAIAQTYAVGGKLVSVPVLAQFYYGVLALWRPVPSGTIAFAASCRPDCAKAIDRIHRFWSDEGQALAGLIPERL